MDIRPIRTDADYREALSKVDSLWTNATPDTPEGDQLDILVTLIQVYERDHYPIPPPDPVEAIKFRVEQLGIGRKGLEGIIGSRARVAEVLTGTRALSIAMIRRLHRELGIPADILIREVPRPKVARGRSAGGKATGHTKQPSTRHHSTTRTARAEKRVA